MDKFVITIARTYGSGGKSIGRMLARELNVPYYDRELLRMASEESGINEALFAGADENAKRSFFSRLTRGAAYKGEIIPPDSDDFVSNENLFNFQAKVIRDLAEKQSCIIIGRCADFILRDVPYVLRLYVHAPFEVCMENARMVHPALGVDEVKKLILKINKERDAYYAHYTGHSWKDAENYDLCINSSQMSWEKSVALVKAYLEIKLS